MTLTASRGPAGSVFLDLDTCGLYQIDAAGVAMLLRHGLQVPIYSTEFSAEDPHSPAGHACISRESEAVWITHYATGRRFVAPLHWVRTAANGSPTELREIKGT